MDTSIQQPYNVLRIFMPLSSSGTNVTDYYFKGVHVECNRQIALYFTKATANEIGLDETTGIFGYCGDKLPKCLKNAQNVVLINYEMLVTRLVIAGKTIPLISDCVITFYNVREFEESQILNPESNSDYLYHLHKIVRQDGLEQPYESNCTDNNLLWTQSCPQWLSSFLVVQHFIYSFYLIKWLYNSVVRFKKINIREWNYILATVLDLVIGYILLDILSQSKTSVTSVLMTMLEELVNSLSSLLKWLMGAPAGLKLNNAFNKMLGKYFTYHVQLWWLFLDVSSEKLHIIFNFYKVLGYLGFTFQAAMISDLITVCSFHSYCIYVYAARLFNIQIRGLTALMRLFFGRKYNPLRNCIDSCEYSNQELFVGTVAFTILLLLLPTTTMYYAVFTLFRLLYLSIRYLLAKLIYYVQTAPLYTIAVWLIKSPKIGGKICLQVLREQDGAPLLLRVKIDRKPIKELIKHFKPPVVVYKTAQWNNLLSNIFTGKQIV